MSTRDSAGEARRAAYQPEIQGLRAIAVVSVLLFHVGLGWFDGGFLGVDVFFVISGYLITRMIVDEITRTGRLAFGRFYLRRARRLLPAALVTLAATAAAAALILSPTDLARFGRSLAGAAVSASNIVFWRESGYFDVGAEFKPLLHTWSLGVEEQFYLFWPLLIVLAMRVRRFALLTVVIAGVVSFVLNGIVFASGVLPFGDAAGGVFFLVPFRIFEFAIGAVLVWLVPRVRLPRVAAEALLVAALLAIVLPVLMYDETMRFPYWAALPPCLGTAAAILTVGHSRLAAFALGNRPAEAIGLISYSLYLVHWPIVVLMRYADGAPLAAHEVVIALGGSFAAATLLYLLVEKPLRYGGAGARVGGRTALAGGAALLTAVVATGVLMSAGGGWSWRIPAADRSPSDAQLRGEEDRRFCGQPDPAKPPALFTCQHFVGGREDIVIWGDSHALHLVGGFATAYPDRNVTVMYLNGCVPQSGFGGYRQRLPTTAATEACVARNRKALDFLETARAATVVVVGAKRGRPERMAAISDGLVRRISGYGHRAIFLGDVIRPGRPILNCRSVPRWLIGEGALAARCAPDPEAVRQDLSYNRRLAASSRTLVDPTPVQCPEGRCIFRANGQVLFRDEHHLSWRGAAYLVGELRRQQTLPS